MPAFRRLGLLVPLALAACDAGGKNADTSAAGPSLSIASPKMDQVVKPLQVTEKKETSPGKVEDVKKEVVEVLFDLRDYEIGKVQDGKNGQHVHLIVDDGPYVALYDLSKAIPLENLSEGTHVVRAFPSAGPKDGKGALHHESRKNAGAFAWVRFHVGKKSTDPEIVDFDPWKKPTLTYSRPKGEYKAGSPEVSKFLLDFYVTGCSLSKDGYRVRATLDGKASEYPEWKPYVLDPGPGPGEHEMVLELLDRNGAAVDGPFNKTTRKFKVVN